MRLNLGLDDLPSRCDVLVVGCGPAGSAAARQLALAGRSVVMVDQHAFPRDKVCGDALIPDAHRALAQLGLLERVLAQATPVAHAAVTGPRGGRLAVPGRLAVLPRRRLDHLLATAAVEAGARMVAPLRFVAPLEDTAPGRAPRVVGARLRAGDRTVDVQARWVLLATGAQPQALQAAGLAHRRGPSGLSMRAYLRNDAMRARLTDLEMVWHPRLKSGYGWVFPGPNGVFNLGVYVTDSHRDDTEGRSRMQDINLRQAFDHFQAVCPMLRELVQGGEWLGGFKGAPVRCSLRGSQPQRPGLLAIGEAVGTTYLLSGEGIGKALETGLLAAQAIAESPEARVEADYERALMALRPHYQAYDRGNRANHHPWLVDLLVWAARGSPRRIDKLAAVLDERHTPRDVMSAASWWRLLTSRR